MGGVRVRARMEHVLGRCGVKLAGADQLCTEERLLQILFH